MEHFGQEGIDIMIKLTNINLDEVTMIEQIRKVGEEHCEFITAVLKKDNSNAIEEFYDLLQASLGALDKMGISAKKVMEQYPKHLEKIKNRPREKYDFGIAFAMYRKGRTITSVTGKQYNIKDNLSGDIDCSVEEVRQSWYIEQGE